MKCSDQVYNVFHTFLTYHSITALNQTIADNIRQNFRKLFDLSEVVQRRLTYTSRHGCCRVTDSQNKNFVFESYSVAKHSI